MLNLKLRPLHKNSWRCKIWIASKPSDKKPNVCVYQCWNIKHMLLSTFFKRYLRFSLTRATHLLCDILMRLTAGDSTSSVHPSVFSHTFASCRRVRVKVRVVQVTSSQHSLRCCLRHTMTFPPVFPQGRKSLSKVKNNCVTRSEKYDFNVPCWNYTPNSL